MSLCSGFDWSRLTGSESQGQEEAAYGHPATTTTGVLFTATNTVKSLFAVAQSCGHYYLVIIELVHFTM